MANALFYKAKEKFLQCHPNINLLGTINVALVDSADWAVNVQVNEFLSEINTNAAFVGTPKTLTNATVTNGVFDADDVTFSSVSGDQFEYLLIYADTGTAATSPLIALFDTATGLAFTPSGSDIILTWSNGASKIFAM